MKAIVRGFHKFGILAGAALLSGCVAVPSARSGDDQRTEAIHARDRQLQILEAARQSAQRRCADGQQEQCQRVQILSHEMDAFLVRPW